MSIRGTLEVSHAPHDPCYSVFWHQKHGLFGVTINAMLLQPSFTNSTQDGKKGCRNANQSRFLLYNFFFCSELKFSKTQGSKFQGLSIKSGLSFRVLVKISIINSNKISFQTQENFKLKDFYLYINSIFWNLFSMDCRNM